ncbi:MULTISPECIES: hypothetical protein [Rhodobacterales]|uniref:hypothetical protein n=1 Tax=Rhodobacterales TaxID=204455 RepID=UPI0011BEEBB1|nr:MULTISPECIES: hypothetical protein [Rhodobacterales]MDO6591549.1 hypothetical protein [Yoonia sp. 1_MG-2023]
MHTQPPNLGTIFVPFSYSKQAKALNEEDAFMLEHGGYPARIIYLVVIAATGAHDALKPKRPAK